MKNILKPTVRSLKATRLETFTKVIILLMLYFLQGLPFGMQEKLLPVYFKTKGYDYTRIFLFRIIHLPWMCKMIYAPIVDQIENKKQCIVVTLFFLTLLYLGACLLDTENCFRIVAAMVLINFFISFQDVALDTLALNSLGETELGHGNSAQVIGYKLGMTVGSGGFAYMIFRWGLYSPFLLMAGLHLIALGGFVLTSAFELPRKNLQCLTTPPASPTKALTDTITSTSNSVGEIRKRSCCSPPIRIPISPVPREFSPMPVSMARVFSDNKFGRNSSTLGRLIKVSQYNYVQLFEAKGTYWLMIFVLTYKLGETGILSMFPLFLIDAGIQDDVVFWWNGIVGHLASILGSIVGGQLSSTRSSIYYNLIYFCVIRFVIILFLTMIVLETNEPFHETKDFMKLNAGLICMTALSFVSGLVTTVTFTLMMHSSRHVPRQSQAFYYSFLSTMEVGGKLAFIIGMGPLVDHYGEDICFLTCFVVSLLQLPILAFYPDTLG